MPPHSGNFEAVDASSMPSEPPIHLIYRHHAQLRTSLRAVWGSRDIIYTLAERDIRAQYKQATLGLLWALIAPLALLAIFTVIFSRTQKYGIPGIPTRSSPTSGSCAGPSSPRPWALAAPRC